MKARLQQKRETGQHESGRLDADRVRLCEAQSQFEVFWEGVFFAPWATFGAQGARKAPKMEPKWSQKGA